MIAIAFVFPLNFDSLRYLVWQLLFVLVEVFQVLEADDDDRQVVVGFLLGGQLENGVCHLSGNLMNGQELARVLHVTVLLKLLKGRSHG